MALKAEMFPTPVGMNRDIEDEEGDEDDVPHTSGDEPQYLLPMLL